MVVEFFEVVLDGCRWLQVVPSFSNYGLYEGCNGAVVSS